MELPGMRPPTPFFSGPSPPPPNSPGARQSRWPQGQAAGDLLWMPELLPGNFGRGSMGNSWEPEEGQSGIRQRVEPEPCWNLPAHTCSPGRPIPALSGGKDCSTSPTEGSLAAPDAAVGGSLRVTVFPSHPPRETFSRGRAPGSPRALPPYPQTLSPAESQRAEAWKVQTEGGSWLGLGQGCPPSHALHLSQVDPWWPFDC